MRTPLRNFFFGGPGGASPLADFGLLVLRLTGLMLAFGHGLGKLPPNEQMVGGVSSMGFPAPALFAWLAALSEFGGGLLLALGLFTRPAALMVVLTMAVAAFRVHANDPWFMTGQGGAKEPALLFLLPALALLFTGSGRFGLDALFRGRRRSVSTGDAQGEHH